MWGGIALRSNDVGCVTGVHSVLILDPIDQRNGVNGDPVAASDPAEALVALRFDRDVPWRDTYRVRKPCAHGLGVWTDPWLLRDNGDIHVDDLVVLGLEECDGANEQSDGIGASIGFVAGGKVGPDVTEGRRTEEGVSDGVGDRVGIRVTGKPKVARNLDATEDQTASAHEPMRVVSVSDAHGRSLTGGCGGRSPAVLSCDGPCGEGGGSRPAAFSQPG